MNQYEVKPYKKGGWVIVATATGREVIVFNDQREAEKACRMLNEMEE